MNNQIKNISYSPFILALTFAVLKSIKTKKILQGEKYVIDADLVPRLSEKTMQHSINQPQIIVAPSIETNESNIDKKPKELIPALSTRQMPQKISPLQNPINQIPKKTIQPKQQPPIIKKQSLRPRIANPISPPISPPKPPVAKAINPPLAQNAKLTNDYGKIQNLLLDESVSTIECSGPGKQIGRASCRERVCHRV